ncbi:MAG: class I SAM-dependent rRNA methyltransferase [Planctomycetota bacterium]
MSADLSSPVATVVLRSRRAKPFYMHHPWVYSGAIERMQPSPASGDLVVVKDSLGAFVAKGFYDPDSQISVRLVSWQEDEPIDEEWARRKLSQALALRREVLHLDRHTDAYRVVHAEGDGLPGLVIDFYAGHVVLAITDVGIARRRDWFIRAINGLFSPASIFEKDVVISDSRRRVIDARGDVGPAPLPDRVRISEHGLAFDVDVRSGQKTGWYCDQRENRLALAPLVEGKSVLDLFSYSAAFSIYCAKIGNCRSALAIDSSEPAVALARANIDLNGVADRVRVRTDDAFRCVPELVGPGEKFDVVIVDPPKLAFREAHRPKALSAYKEINARALEVLASPGILVSCSCSGVVERGEFLRTINEAARGAGRTLRLVDPRSQASDHPISAACPETEYLKCLILSVI